MKLILLSFISAVLAITGASCVEELDEDVLLHFRDLAEHPIEINTASRSRLLSCGLFSRYQVASLTDYIRNGGDILSYAELGLVDGFNPALAEALEQFTVLRSQDPPGMKRSFKPESSLILNASAKSGGRQARGLRYTLEAGDRAEFHWTLRKSYDSPAKGLGTLSAAYYGKRIPGKLILGDFNARFGQGLLQWSGFSLSSLSSVSAFCRNGTGLSPSSSATSSLKGIAGELNLGYWTVGAAWSFAGRLPFASVSRTGRKATFGLAAVSDGVSAGWRIGAKDISFYGEAACRYSGAAAALAGLKWIPSYGTGTAFLVRWCDPRFGREFSGAAAGVESGGLAATIDAGIRLSDGLRQCKLLATYTREFSLAGITLSPAVRISERFRPDDEDSWRTDLRADLRASWQGWELNGRYNILAYKDFAWLWYAECGYVSESLRMYMRFSLFRIDNWDDRISVYERDARGAFNVPARYGRGWSVSLFAQLKARKHSRFNLRLETVQYPWNLTEKPGSAEIKLQYEWR